MALLAIGPLLIAREPVARLQQVLPPFTQAAEQATQAVTPFLPQEAQFFWILLTQHLYLDQIVS